VTHTPFLPPSFPPFVSLHTKRQQEAKDVGRLQQTNERMKEEVAELRKQLQRKAELQREAQEAKEEAARKVAREAAREDELRAWQEKAKGWERKYEEEKGLRYVCGARKGGREGSKDCHDHTPSHYPCKTYSLLPSSLPHSIRPLRVETEKTLENLSAQATEQAQKLKDEKAAAKADAKEAATALFLFKQELTNEGKRRRYLEEQLASLQVDNANPPPSSSSSSSLHTHHRTSSSSALTIGGGGGARPSSPSLGHSSHSHSHSHSRSGGISPPVALASADSLYPTLQRAQSFNGPGQGHRHQRSSSSGGGGGGGHPSSHRLVEALAAQHQRKGGREGGRKGSVGSVVERAESGASPSSFFSAGGDGEKVEGEGEEGRENAAVVSGGGEEGGRKEEEGIGALPRAGSLARRGSANLGRGQSQSLRRAGSSSLTLFSSAMLPMSDTLGREGGREGGVVENDLDMSVDLSDEDQPLLNRSDRLQRRREEVQKLFTRCQLYRPFLQEGITVEVMEIIFPPSLPPSSFSSTLHQLDPASSSTCTFLPVKMRLEGVLSSSSSSSTPRSLPSSLPQGGHDALLKARLVWEETKSHSHHQKRGGFLSSLGWGKAGGSSTISSSSLPSSSLPDAIYLTELYGVVRGLRRVRPRAALVAAATAAAAAAAAAGGGREGGMEHSRLLTLTTLQLPQKPRRGLVLRFGSREERNRFLDCLRKCLGELLQVDLPPSSSRAVGEEEEEEGGKEGGKEVGEGMSAALALLRQRAVVVPKGKKEEGGEEGKEEEDGGSLYVPLTEAQTLLVAERKETRRAFALLLDTEMDTSGLEDENGVMRREVGLLQAALAEKDEALAKALASVHYDQKGRRGGREGGREGRKHFFGMKNDEPKIFIDFFADRARPLSLTIPSSLLPSLPPSLFPTVERVALARKVEGLEMDNADLRQIMEKTDMAQAAQHQEEQRHGQLQLEMQVGFPSPAFLLVVLPSLLFRVFLS